ncbi:hypothetical protein ACFX19_044654 [Malus domestica]
MLNYHLGALQLNWEENHSEIYTVSESINHLKVQEEAYWAACFRIQWLQRHWGYILSCLGPIVTTYMNGMLCSPISDMKIKETMFNMGGAKAPGLDGFQGIFFQSYWDIIAMEVKGIITVCLVGDGCHFPINSINIVMILKVPNPEVVS